MGAALLPKGSEPSGISACARLLLLAALVLGPQTLLAQIAKTAAPPELITASNEVTVYFYRAGGPNRNRDLWVFVDETPVGVIQGRQYVGATLPVVGEHIVWAFGEDVDGMRWRFQAGQTYYFEIATSRTARAGFSIEPAKAEEASAEVDRATYLELTAAGVGQAAAIVDSNFANALDAAELERAGRAAFDNGHEPGSFEDVQAIYEHGFWLEQLDLPIEAREEYQRAISRIEKHQGETSVLLVAAYLHYARTYLKKEFAPYTPYRSSSAQSSLLSALSVAEEHADADPGLLASVLLVLGDYWTGADRRGREYYLRAWETLGASADAEELRGEIFYEASPVFLVQAPFRALPGSESPNAERGFVNISFDINEEGYAGNAFVTRSDPSGLMDEAAIRALRMSLFRPRIKDGRFVPAREMKVEYRFDYLPEG